MAREDLARHRADRVQNSAEVEVVAADRDAFERRRWSEVRTGDVVRVRSRESFPADLLLLAASEPTPGQVHARRIVAISTALSTALRPSQTCEPASHRTKSPTSGLRVAREL